MPKTHPSSPSPANLADQLAIAWPPSEWRDVHVLVAVSGGPDSMALLRCLLSVKQQVGGKGELLVGHVNHQLRGASALADQQWLQQECESLGLPLIVRAGNVREAASAEGDGLEAAARAERYRLLVEMAERRGARYLAVGHHREDQIETVLFRLFRGTGLRGLCGMPRTRTLAPSVTLVRPLLDCQRELLRAFLAEMGQSYRVDQSNSDTNLTRNWIRHCLLPQLRSRVNTDVSSALWRTMGQLTLVEQAVVGVAQQILARTDCTVEARQGFSLSTMPLAAEPDYLVAEVMRAAWRSAALPEQGMTQDSWQQLAAVALGRQVGPVTLPGNISAFVESGQLVLKQSGDC